MEKGVVLFCKCFGIPNSPRSLDLDDPQGLIASSAVQQKKMGGERGVSLRVPGMPFSFSCSGSYRLAIAGHI